MATLFSTFCFIAFSSPFGSLGNQAPEPSKIIDVFNKKYHRNVVKPFETLIQQVLDFNGLNEKLKKASKEAGENPDQLKLNFTGAEEKVKQLENIFSAVVNGIKKLSTSVLFLEREANATVLTLLGQGKMSPEELKTLSHLQTQLNETVEKIEKDLDQAEKEIETAKKAHEKAETDYKNLCSEDANTTTSDTYLWIKCLELDKQKELANHDYKLKQELRDEHKRSLENGLANIALINDLIRLNGTKANAQELQAFLATISNMRGVLQGKLEEIEKLESSVTTSEWKAKLPLIISGVNKTIKMLNGISGYVKGDGETEKKKEQLKALKPIAVG